MSYKLMLEDMPDRTPQKIYGEFDWIVASTFESFKEIIRSKGIPDSVSFDHDIRPEHYALTGYGSPQSPTGADAARWLCSEMSNLKHFASVHASAVHHTCLDIRVHSMNPDGAENIISIVNSWYKAYNIDCQAKRVVWWKQN